MTTLESLTFTQCFPSSQIVTSHNDPRGGTSRCRCGDLKEAKAETVSEAAVRGEDPLQL